MKSLRSIATLAILILQLCGCANNNADKSHKAAIEELEHRHAVTMDSMGGGGGSM